MKYEERLQGRKSGDSSSLSDLSRPNFKYNNTDNDYKLNRPVEFKAFYWLDVI